MMVMLYLALTFQFTHPARGATEREAKSVLGEIGFNSRTPRGVRPNRVWAWKLRHLVSIHAPREGCDIQ